MTVLTNVPLPTFGPNGFTSPTEGQILAGVLADFQTAFGSAMNVSLASPQGQLAQSLTALIGALYDYYCDYAAQADPAFAQGRMQDAIGRIYFLIRGASSPTTVTATCAGATGTVLPAGTLAVATDGTIYASTVAATILSGGSVSIPFAAITNGPIACPAGTLNSVYRAVSGWDSITNPADGVPGQDVESPNAFEARREATVSANSIGMAASARGWLLGNTATGAPVVPGIVDAYVTENSTTSPVTVNGQTIAANSLFVCVQGGADADVAAAIFAKKPPGCATTGSTSVTVTDTNAGYASPPSYTIKFQRAAGLSCAFAVQIQNKPDVPSNYQALIQTAIATAFPSQANIGRTLYALGMASAIAALGPWARIVSITVNTAASQAVQINQYPTLGAVTASLV